MDRLRQEVARAICEGCTCIWDIDPTAPSRDAWMTAADVAIRTVLEALETPSAEMLCVGGNEFWAAGDAGSIWQAMLAQFKKDIQ